MPNAPESQGKNEKKKNKQECTKNVTVNNRAQEYKKRKWMDMGMVKEKGSFRGVLFT